MTDHSRLERERPSEQPLVSVIIPHYLGDVVSRCLASLSRATRSVSCEVIVVDDQPRDDGSLARASAAFPTIRVTRTYDSHGFGAACNAGLRIARGTYVAILNNDAVVARGWLEPLVAAADADPTVAVFQSKIRSLQNPARFDYSGAAGGLIDWLGFPFALGRVFDGIEEDFGQHDQPRDIFWAVGTGMFIRRSCLAVTGSFDESFYMHMEEIDLCWRLQLAGFRIRSCPGSVVYHANGFSLKQGSFKKTYLNHRNNFVLLLKNLPGWRALLVLPTRVVLVAAVAVLGLVRRDWRQPIAALLGTAWAAFHFTGTLVRRCAARSTRTVDDRLVIRAMYARSIAVDYFLRHIDAEEIVSMAKELSRTIPSATQRSSASHRGTASPFEVTLAGR